MTRERKYPEQPVVGVGGVVISNGEVLLIRRKSPPLEGEWSIPGGMLEVGLLPRCKLTRRCVGSGARGGTRARSSSVGRVDSKYSTEFFSISPTPLGPTGISLRVILDFLCAVIGGTCARRKRCQ